MEPWKEKAHAVIAALSKKSYEQANRLSNGRLRKRHVPYSIPEQAQQLVKCLGNEDEEGAKALFVYDYEISKLGETL